MSKFITLATFTYPQEAYLTRSRLEAEGITVFLKNELTIQTDNFLSNAMGGVQLQVHVEDVELALKIIKDFDLLPAHMIHDEPVAESKPETWTSHIPLIRKLPGEIRVFALVAAVLLLGTAIFYLL